MCEDCEVLYTTLHDLLKRIKSAKIDIMGYHKIKVSDTSVIELLEQIHKMFYSNVSERFCRQRMKILFDRKQIKRHRSHIDTQYVYYIEKKPYNPEHRLLVADLYLALQAMNYTVNDLAFEFKCGNIRADAYFEISKGNISHSFFVEVHLSNKFNQDKYEELLESEEWKKDFEIFPKILIITDKAVEKRTTKLRIYTVKNNLEGLDKIF